MKCFELFKSEPLIKLLFFTKEYSSTCDVKIEDKTVHACITRNVLRSCVCINIFNCLGFFCLEVYVAMGLVGALKVLAKFDHHSVFVISGTQLNEVSYVM